MRQFANLVAATFCVISFIASAANADPVKIALPVASLESLPIYVAEESGLFKKHGVQTDIITSRGGGEAMKAYLAGEVQIVATGFPEIGLMRSRGIDVQLFFAQTARVPFALMGRQDLAIKSIADLKGKIVAVTSPGSLTAYLTRYFVLKAGLDPDKDISLVSVGGGGELLGALKSKRADAAMLFEPFVTIGLSDGFATMVVDVPKELDAFSSSPLSTSKTFLEKSPRDAKAVFDALAEALTIIHTNKEAALEVAKKKFVNADLKVLKAALDRLETIYSIDGRFSRANIEQTQKISVDLKIMPKVYPYEEVVAPFAREAGK